MGASNHAHNNQSVDVPLGLLGDAGLRLSSIFEWYLGDSEGSKADLVQYLAEHSSVLTSLYLDL